jgi:hypothetical protein
MAAKEPLLSKASTGTPILSSTVCSNLPEASRQLPLSSSIQSMSVADNGNDEAGSSPANARCARIQGQKIGRCHIVHGAE